MKSIGISARAVIFISASITLGYGPLLADTVYSWSDCVKAAELYHPDLQQAKAQIDKAKAGKSLSKSGYLPNVTLDAAMEKGGSDSTGDQSVNYSYGITGSQVLFDGLKTYYTMKETGSALAQARFQYMYVSSTVRYNLRIAYIQMLRSKEEQRILGEIVALRKKNYDFVHLRYKAGREHIGALLKSKANLANAEFELSRAKRNALVYQKQIVNRMGLKSSPAITVEGVVAVEEKALVQPDFELIIKQNPSLLALTKEREAAQYAMKSTLAGFSPQISAYGTYGKSDNVFLPEKSQWSVGIKATYPLFEGGATYYQYLKAAAQEKILAAEVVSTENDLALSLEQKWHNLNTAVKYIAVRQSYLEAAEERSIIAQSQYNLGLTTYDSWIIIEDELVNNKKALMEARFDAMVAEAEWLYARGVMLNDEE